MTFPGMSGEGAIDCWVETSKMTLNVVAKLMSWCGSRGHRDDGDGGGVGRG